MRDTSSLKSGYAGPSNWPCCGVTAVATACEVPFASVLEYMRDANNLGQGWKGSSTLAMCKDALKHFGATFNVTSFQRKYNKVRFWQWALLYAKPYVTYLVDVPGHTVVFRAGMIIDQGHTTPTYFAHHERIGGASVTNVTEILSIPSSVEREQMSTKAKNELMEIF